MQPMNQARERHSSCYLAGCIYVFCGLDNNARNLDSVEKLSINPNSSQQALNHWERIPNLNLVDLPVLREHFSVPLNNQEILILGGYEFSERKVHVYDTRTDQCSSIAVTGAFKFYNIGSANYSIAQYDHNKVVALVNRVSVK